jgi:hypothetical protein
MNHRVEVSAGAISTLQLVHDRDGSEKETRVAVAPGRNHVVEIAGEVESVNSYPTRGIWRSRAMLQRTTLRRLAS